MWRAEKEGGRSEAAAAKGKEAWGWGAAVVKELVRAS